MAICEVQKADGHGHCKRRAYFNVILTKLISFDMEDTVEEAMCTLHLNQHCQSLYACKQQLVSEGWAYALE